MASRQTYYLTNESWPNEGYIVIHNAEGEAIATLSREFLRRGHVLNWHYILQASLAGVNEQGQIYRSTTEVTDAYAPLDVSQVEQIPMDEVPIQGHYYFLCESLTQPTTWSIGPRFKYARRAPSGTTESTMSHSSRSTVNQSTFRHLLKARDFWCLVSDTLPVQAAHILPQSRPEYYREIRGFDPISYFHVSFGLLLSPAIHHAFDRGEVGFYPDPSDESVLIVHFFTVESTPWHQYHGRRIPPSRFRVGSPTELPRRDFLAFHYKQCCIKHIRGFSEF